MFYRCATCVAVVWLMAFGLFAGCSASSGERFVSQDISQYPIADGVILEADAPSREVYINLGARDKVRPGMMFYVYKTASPPRSGLGGLFTGNSVASVEVLSVDQKVALCRIVNTPNIRRLGPGDLIASDIYRMRKIYRPSFVLTGDFDLDGDGVATAAERDRMMRLIASYGGMVETTLTAHTDYLVAGTRPITPAIVPIPADDRPGTTQHQRLVEQVQYDKTVDRAATGLYIRILNTQRFLELVDPPTVYLSDH